MTALVEWPVPIAGRFDERFLALPREVLIATLQDHQRYFPVQGADGRLTARLHHRRQHRKPRTRRRCARATSASCARASRDAAFFWDQDRKTPLAEHAARRSARVTFQTQLGCYADKTSA